MKKFLVLYLFLSTSFIGWSQDITNPVQPSAELKINAFNLIAFTFIDISYEHLLNEESSLGLGILFNVADNNEILDEFRSFSLTPYYRQYFSNQYAKGFFLEGFGMVNSGNEADYYADFEMTQLIKGEQYTAFALGISVGGKFVTPRGFAVEIYTGLGRNLFGSDISPDIISRGGVSLGFRF